VWDIPVGHSRRYLARANRLVDGVLGGWQLAVINTASKRLPVNLNYSPSSAFQVSGLPTYRPNIIGSPLTPNGGPTNY